MSIIYKEEGFDVSDDGKSVKNIENSIDFTLFIKRLPEKDRKIAEMIADGYTRREIVNKLKVGEHRVSNIGTKLDKIMVK